MSTPEPKSDAAAARGFRIPAGSPWAGAWRYPMAVSGLGLGMAAIGWWKAPERFAFSYLFAFYVALSIAAGHLFFILVLYQTKASWGITVRRIAENFVKPMSVFAFLAIPLVCPVPGFRPDPLALLFPWDGHKAPAAEVEEQASFDWSRGDIEKEPAGLREIRASNQEAMTHASESEEDGIVKHKSFYLSKPFFLVRLILVLGLFTILGSYYVGWSTEQDETKSKATTALAQRMTPPALIVFAICLTMFAFDWLLSLDATWYSTMFGVYVFAQCALVQMATLVLLALALQRAGLLGNAVNVEHFHDMGKLLFGWVAFWTYISFAQFFLTWYSNIPDEVAWFHKRWDGNGGTWMATSVALVVLHFFVPFWFLMSRNIKRRLWLLAAGAVCLVVMHVVEAYWIIMPNLGPMDLHPLDLGCLVGIVGLYFALVLRGLTEHALVPVGDPRLQRALEFENA